MAERDNRWPAVAHLEGLRTKNEAETGEFNWSLLNPLSTREDAHGGSGPFAHPLIVRWPHQGLEGRDSTASDHVAVAFGDERQPLGWSTPRGVATGYRGHGLDDASGLEGGIRDWALRSREMGDPVSELTSRLDDLEVTNEELQSTIEAMEMTNDALQAVADEQTRAIRQLESRHAMLEATSQIRNEANALFRAALSMVDVGLIILDEYACIRGWNAKVEQLSGLSADNVCGRDVFSVESRIPIEQLAPAIRATRATRMPNEKTITCTTRSGERVATTAAVRALRSEGVTGVVVVLEEVESK